MLGLAGVNLDVAGLGVLADDHALVDRRLDADEELTALLGVEKPVGRRFSRLGCDERAGGTRLHLALEGVIALENRVHDALAAGGGQEFAPVSEEAAARDEILELHARAAPAHRHELSLAGAETLHDVAHIFLGDVDDDGFERLAFYAVYIAVEHARSRERKLKALAAHSLDEDRKVHLAAARDLEAVRGLAVLDAERHVLEELAVEPLAYLPRRDVFAFFPGKRAVVDREGHLDRRLGDLDEGKRLGAGDGRYCVAYRYALGPGEADDVPGICLLDGLSAEAVELLEGHDAGLYRRHIVVVIADADVLILSYDSALDAAYAHAADVVVVVYRGDEHLELAVLVALRRGNVFENGLKERAQVGAGLVRRIRRRAGAAGAEEHGAVELLVRRVEIHEELEDLVLDLFDARVRLVDLVDYDDYRVIELERLLEHEARLRHRALGGVDEKDYAVYHLEYAFDLSREIRVSGSVDYIDFHVAVVYRRVFREDRYPALALEGVAVHYALDGRLIFAVHAALLEQLIDERRLAVVDVSDDRHVP